jgi:hypothetical protein
VCQLAPDTPGAASDAGAGGLRAVTSVFPVLLGEPFACHHWAVGVACVMRTRVCRVDWMGSQSVLSG